jgi:hypothetical protein
LANCIDRGLNAVKDSQETIRLQIADVALVNATLDPANGSAADRQARFQSLQEQFHTSTADPIRQHMAKLMSSFLPGLFVGGDQADFPHDNLDLERWFRLPKSHERRIHGHRHAGVRIVQEGPTLIPVLDAHHNRPHPFSPDDLLPFRNAAAPDCQHQAIHRRTIMRKARSKKRRPALLQDLERRYQEAGG